MDTQIPIDLAQTAHELHLPADLVQRTVELLDDGNTVPFITRFRREQTGGFDEEHIRAIQEAVKRRRQLVERKQTILKTIGSQGKLTPELQYEIEHANNLKRLEDLYLPYKPKKQTLATQARERGLEPLALQILNAEVLDLEARLAELVDAEKGIATTTDVLEGVQHLAAERISERADLRGRLRRIFFRSGRLICTEIEKPPEPAVESIAEPIAATEPVSSDLPSDPQPASGVAGELNEAAIPPAVADTAEFAESTSAGAFASEPVASESVANESVASETATESEVTAPGENQSAGDSQPVSEATAAASPGNLSSSNLSHELPSGRLFDKPQSPIMAPVDKKRKRRRKRRSPPTTPSRITSISTSLSPSCRLIACWPSTAANGPTCCG